MDWTLLFILLGVLVAAFVKGGVGFGFPTIATPLVAVVTDVRSAVVLLIVPNLIMDFLQIGRRPGLLRPIIRRHWIIYLFTVIGTFVGTKFLATLGTRPLILFLGFIILFFVLMSLFKVAPRIPRGWQGPLGPPLGFVSGVIGGLTNLAGHLLIIYFYSIGLQKEEFVRALSTAFIVIKVAQLFAVWQFNLLEPRVFALSFFASGVALIGFGGGVLARDRIDQQSFNRAVLVVLALIGVGMVIRGLRSGL